MNNIMGELNEINENEVFFDHEEAIKNDSMWEHTDANVQMMQMAKLKAKITRLKKDIEYEQKHFEKLFSLYHKNHPDEIEEIVSKGLLRT